MAHFRHPKLLEERLALHSEYVVTNPEEIAGQWRSLLPECRQLCVDVGCGKGLWTSAAANAWQDSLFVGVDHELMCISFAAEQAAVGGVASSGWAKSADEGFVAPKNIRFVCAPASAIGNLFSEGEIDHLFLNYPTPFPKKKETANRIVNANHLHIYGRLLAPRGILHFRTDSQPLFDYTLEQLKQAHFEVVALTRDLYGENAAAFVRAFGTPEGGEASEVESGVAAVSEAMAGETPTTKGFSDFSGSFDDVDKLPSAYERKTLMRGAKIHALHARLMADSALETHEPSEPEPISLYDYLPENLDEITYVPLGMENALLNMRNRRKNGRGGVWGQQ